MNHIASKKLVSGIMCFKISYFYYFQKYIAVFLVILVTTTTVLLNNFVFGQIRFRGFWGRSRIFPSQVRKTEPSTAAARNSAIAGNGREYFGQDGITPIYKIKQRNPYGGR